MLCSVYKVRENGLEDSVMTVEEIRSGTESLGTGRRKPPFKFMNMILVCVT